MDNGSKAEPMSEIELPDPERRCQTLVDMNAIEEVDIELIEWLGLDLVIVTFDELQITEPNKNQEDILERCPKCDNYHFYERTVIGIIQNVEYRFTMTHEAIVNLTNQESDPRMDDCEYMQFHAQRVVEEIFEMQSQRNNVKCVLSRTPRDFCVVRIIKN